MVLCGGVLLPKVAWGQQTVVQRAAFTLRGVVRSGATPLPGVTVTLVDAVSKKRMVTTTNLAGEWQLEPSAAGSYIVWAQFAGFAPGHAQVELSESVRTLTVPLSLQLISRAQAEERQRTGNGNGNGYTLQSQNQALLASLSSQTEQQVASTGSSGAALPSVASSSDFSGETVSVSGQAGSVSPMAGMDHPPEGGFGGPGGPGGGLFGGAPMMMGGPGGFGAPGGGRGNFRGFNASQPHGSVFWMGSNAALDADPFSLRGQKQSNPASGSNRFGITFMSAPYLPHLTKASGKDTIFFTLSGQRSSSPSDQYATVPTEAEREGTVSGLGSITPVAQATALLCPATASNCTPWIPLPNLASTTSSGYNYHSLTTAQSNSTQLGARYMRSLGKNAQLPGARGMRRTQSQGLRQSVSFNYNWSKTAADSVNVFPELGGKTASESNALQAGYTVGYHRLTSIFNASWNRATSSAANIFTGTDDNIASTLGISIPNSNALNYGLPGISITGYTGLSDVQPSSSVTETFAYTEVVSWMHGKHNMRFGGEFHRAHRDFLGGSNATGSFTFTGSFTGSALGDFLAGNATASALDLTAGKSYLRQSIFNLYAQDDWRATSSLTLNYGLRYELFTPYSEINHHLAMLDTNAETNATYGSAFEALDEVQAGGVGTVGGSYAQSLVHGDHLGISPRFGMALRLPRKTVMRAGYGLNYTVGQYSTFATSMARQPMASDASFVNEQSNTATTAGAITLASGFAASSDALGSYAVDPHYRLPYVQAWNVDLQKTLPWGVMLNVGYNGSRGSRLDQTIAPRANASSPLTNSSSHIFNYEFDGASSHFNAATVRLNKRMSGGVAVGANYQYAHSIDNAGSVGGTSTVVAQNWQNLKAEEGNSSFDQRHKVSGNYLFELPFGRDKRWATIGMPAVVLEGFSVSGSFTFASGTPLTPKYSLDTASVSCGTAGSLRPDRDLSQSITAGGGGMDKWFNTSAFTKPTAADSNYPCNVYGSAARNSIPGPGTVTNNMSLAKTMQMGTTRSMEVRATANNVFNTVQYAGVDTSVDSSTFGEVTSTSSMRQFQFTARFRF